MRYANLSYVGGEQFDEEKSRINLGDYMQLLAIDHMYEEMGIPYEEIYRISIKDIGTYVGECLILPINFMMMDCDFCRNGKIIISEYIIPVFIGISIYRNGFTLSEHNIEYFKKFAPVGCRDYGSYKLLKERGVMAYLSGCISLAMPRRAQKEYRTVYFVDVPEYVKENIPKEYLKGCKFVHHERELGKREFLDLDYARNMARDLLEEYRDNARLVITSRLHCASPCMGMNIPTIIVREYKGYTFDWINQFIAIYLWQDRESINWYPEEPSLDREKQIILDTAINRLRETESRFDYVKASDLYPKWRGDFDVYENCQSVQAEKMHQKIRAKWMDRDTAFSYALWGISEDAESVYQYISSNYKNARLVKVIDTYRDVEFHGLKREMPDVIQRHNDYFIIVVPVNAVNAAKVFFQRIGKSEEEYMYIADTFIDGVD